MDLNLRYKRKVLRFVECEPEQATAFINVLWDGINGEPMPVKPRRRRQGKAVHRAMRKLRARAV